MLQRAIVARTSGSSGSCSPSAGSTASPSALAALVGGPALIFDARGEPSSCAARTASRCADATVDELRGELRERASATARAAASRPAASSRAARSRCRSCARRRAAPAAPGDVPHAWLVAAKDAGALTEFDRLTLHQAVTIVALELLRRRVADDTERRLAGDVLTALVSGELERRRARAPARAVRPRRARRRARAAAAAREQAPRSRRR